MTTKSSRTTIPDEQYERLDAIRDRHGVTWRGMLLQGATRLESMNPLADLHRFEETGEGEGEGES